MIRVVRVKTLALGLAILAALAAQSRSVRAQEPCLVTGARWCIVDALGYSTVGAVVSRAAGAGLDRSANGGSGVPGEFIFMVMGGVVGFAAGWGTGASAGDAYENGRTLTTGHRIAVAAGAIPAGAILGAFVAYQVRRDNESGGTSLGSNKEATAILVGTGAALGAVYAWGFRHTLTGKKVAAMPLVTPQRFGMIVRMQP